MENFYVAWLHNIAAGRMALRSLPGLSQVGYIERVRLNSPKMGLACASPTWHVYPGVAQIPQGALALGNRRGR
jgi:hypothetical protein